MRLSDLEQRLVEAMASFEIIDAHEHLGPEQDRIDTPVDVFTLFSHYTRGDLIVSGMTEDAYTSLFNHDIPLDRRWAIFAPHWEVIRWGAYARAARLAARKFYDVDDINETTYEVLSERMRQNNTPGLYERVLKEACNIRTALTQCGRTDLGSPLLTPVMPLIMGELDTWDGMLQAASRAPDPRFRSLDDFVDLVLATIEKHKAEGAVGFKMMANPYDTPACRQDALGAFESLQDGTAERLPAANPLRDYVLDKAIAHVGRLDVVQCVHTGYWGDFRQLDPLHMIPVLQRHPEVRFDIYHLGYPWMREAIMLGKGFPNVWLNLCWTHIISPRFVMLGLDELIDTVPMNKIIAFGGDYGLPVEKTYGHLVMARENIARVLAGRIEQGDMSETQALDIARLWFWDNPKGLYRLPF